MEAILEAVRPYLPFIYALLPVVLGLASLALQGKLKGYAQQTVAAVYRVSIHAAAELQEEGLGWLRSEDGIAFRKELAEKAYDVLPAKIGPVPVGILKAVISRERFCIWVEQAFQEMAELAGRLEFPVEVQVEGE